MVKPNPSGDLVVVPANEASWEDLQAVLGERGIGAECQCQRFKLERRESFGSVPVAVRAERLRAQTCVGERAAPSTTGLVAYRGDEPVGWCGVQPRREYGGLLRVDRTPWVGRDEDKEGTLMTWGEEFVGFPQVFGAAGFAEVSRPGVRRVVMRVDFEPVGRGDS